MLTQEELKETLRYSPEDGLFTRMKSNTRVSIGDVAGSTDKDGYVVIKFLGKTYKAHRLAWLYIYGEFPSSCLDHIDGNKANNSISNLRLASVAENQHNAKLRVDNKSGVKGIVFDKGKWLAQVRYKGKLHIAGRFSTVEEGILPLQRLREELHREFTNHG